MIPRGCRSDASETALLTGIRTVVAKSLLVDLSVKQQSSVRWSEPRGFSHESSILSCPQIVFLYE